MQGRWGWRRSRCLAATTGLVLALAAAPVSALVVAPSPAEGEERAGGEDREVGESDPLGLEHVGSHVGGEPSVVYLGGGWVLTAEHVGVGAVHLAGETHPPLPQSRVVLENPDGSRADLILYRIRPSPALEKLAPLAIARRTPARDTPVVMIAHGRRRADQSALSSTLERLRRAGADHRASWGRNRVTPAPTPMRSGRLLTHALVSDFSAADDPLAMPREAQATSGDSGGAVLVEEEGETRLAGVILAVAGGGASGEPETTWSADLSRYRDSIHRWTSTPCAPGAACEAGPAAEEGPARRHALDAVLACLALAALLLIPGVRCLRNGRGG